MWEELSERLRLHLIQIIRERDPYFATQGHFYVQQYVRQELARWGPVVEQDFRVHGMKLQNLVLDLPAQVGRDRPPILIGAHYDAVPNCPGADDNATGVAVLLELARLFSALPPRYPVRLVAFDLEETSYELAGSTYYARSLNQAPLRLMISLEMLGYCNFAPGSQQYPAAGLQYFYPNQGDFIGLIGNLKTIPDLIHLSRIVRQTGTPSAWLPAGQRGLVVPATRRSDHAIFWDLGYRALMVTDTSYLRNPHYHLPSDRLETLDLNFLAGVCQGLAVGIQRL